MLEYFVPVIPGSVRGSSRDKLSLKQGLEYPQQRRWHWKFCCFENGILKNQMVMVNLARSIS